MSFARKPHTHPQGPLDHMLKTEVPENMHDDFLFMAGLQGKSKSELLRDIIDEYLNGAVRVARSHAQHSMCRAINGRESGE